MNTPGKTWRVIWRFGWLMAEVLLAFLRFAVLYLRTCGGPSRHQRAVCLHHGCRRALRVIVDRVDVLGPRPARGLLVSNHLSYLDILLFSALAPGVFVSKHEIKSWPLLGWFARLGGTVFVQRERRGHVGEISARIHELLEKGELVFLFPEGTSGDGESVLPFKSSLLEPAVGLNQPVFAAGIDYFLAGGSVKNDVCYWGDMTFFPHLLLLLRHRFVQARVSFREIGQPAGDRKALARQLQAEVVRLRVTVRSPASVAAAGNSF